MANEITEVCLMSVPLEKDYKHTYFFENETEQMGFFGSKIQRRFIDFSYQKKDNVIRVPEHDINGLPTHYDDLYKCGVNYVRYKNHLYSDKWFYAFITDIEYINDNRTDIYIELDVMQTWAFDYEVRPSYVEREHVSNDTIGWHTFPEGLELGEYICNLHTEDNKMDFSDLTHILASTLKITKDASAEKFSANGGGKYGGIYSGLKYYRFDNYSDLSNVLRDYENAGQSDCVNGIFMAPKFLCDATNNDVNNTLKATTYTIEIPKQKIKLNGYEPRNKKLLCYPFQYLLVSNNNGSSAIYRQEEFSDGSNCTFSVHGVLTPGCSIRLIPTNYKGETQNDEEGLNGGKFPTCNWQTDLYTNWMVQNSKQISISHAQNVTSGIAGAIGNAMIGNVGGAIGSVVNSGFAIANTLAEVEKHSLTPPQANGNTNCGDVNTSSGNNRFHFYQMSCKAEYLQKLDGFFDMFGYKVNTLKIPNKMHRLSYWYTKTIDANIDGFNMPQNDLQKIKDIFNAGITFWKNRDYIKNYSVTNPIYIRDNAVVDLTR